MDDIDIYLPQRVESGNKRIEEDGINIEFNNISLAINNWNSLIIKNWKLEKKTILKSINGIFYKNQASVILGCSGSGKSSLLNILSGFRHSGYEGHVTSNGALRNLSSFRKVSSYIMQEDHLQLYLTVLESMKIALKLKYSIIKLENKQNVFVGKLLSDLFLSDRKDTLVYQLSGGERKRLMIALELICSPKVLFFDEPTTGLDIVSANKIIKIIRTLANSGKTVVCSIHQATANHLFMFDLAYVLTPNGQCIYNGDPKQMVNHFSKAGFQCPNYYNPADYVIELSLGEYGDINELIHENVFKYQKTGHCTKKSIIYVRENQRKFLYEVLIIMHRTILITMRDHFHVNIRLFVHFLLGTMFGVVYFGLGNDGMYVRDNAVLLFFCVMFSVYVAAFTMSVKFPLEFSVMQSEYFNQWYSLKSYYISMTIVDLPIQISCSLLFCILIYLLSGQPLETFRVFMFLLMFIMTGLMSQAIGMLVSTFFQNFTINSVVVALILLFWTTYAGGMIRIADTPEIYKWLYDYSFMKHSIQGVLHSVYGFNRSIPCSSIFCLYGSPKFMLQVLGMSENIYWINFSFIVIIYIILKICIYFSIKYKLSSNK
ncbi:ATP-binding cassette subfamily G member 4-like isoform X2 [Daktulosphaira vitifoliae]|uniref:ATP-binding cassette subfamily G member 4-like isoform X2 n=1 Tax=Daktulosphaira vitifoliae TaxID=58002 RepID=UPI0021AA2F3E|nr:ATP-binding cassette subfamily G member 4-like isoform X2 [Daktulosphaira vitifoliae]